jgi:hypothetical protein
MLVMLTPALANAAPPQVSKPDAALTARRWWQQFVAIPGDSLGRCDVGTGEILFLAGTTGVEPGQPVPTRTCTTDKNIFLVPLINVECSRAEGDGGTSEQRRKCAKDFADNFTGLKLVVDGEVVGNLNSLRVQPESSFTAANKNAFGIPPAKNNPFAADGYWALITLAPGEHTITFGGSYPPGPFTTEVTYDLLVQNWDRRVGPAWTRTSWLRRGLPFVILPKPAPNAGKVL